MGSRKRHKRRQPIRAPIQKAAPPQNAQAPQRPEEEDEDQLYELKNMRLPFVSLVTAGANRQTQFMVVKDDESSTKVVPAKDADSETKERAQKARSRQYGIEIKESGSSLSYPAGSPTTETLYGDPVNLAYPFGGTNNAVDLGRVRNAIARFKQNYQAYKQETSRARVYDRIVRRALAEGVDVSYDSNDPVDRLLPADLKNKLSKQTDGEQATGASASGADTTPTRTSKTKADLDAWLASTTMRLDAMRAEVAAQQHLIQATAAPLASPPVPACDTAPQDHVGPGAAPPHTQMTAASAGAAVETDALAKAIAKARTQAAEIARLRAETRQLRKQRSRVGYATAIAAGDAFTHRVRGTTPPKDLDDDIGDLQMGGNLAAQIREKEGV